MCGWVKRSTGLDLESVLLLTALFLFAGAAIGAIADLFRYSAFFLNRCVLFELKTHHLMKYYLELCFINIMFVMHNY